MKGEITFIGIDPGLDGAIVFICPDMSRPCLYTMPITGTGKGREINVVELRRLIMRLKGLYPIVTVEKVHSMPSQGIASAFKFGKGCGQIDATVKSCRAPLIYVTPQAWKKEVLKGMNWKGNKAASIQYCLNRYPGIDLKRTPRCKGPHDGICDALCIAEYGRIKNEQ